MAIGGSAFFDALATRMRWHEARQNLLAENVANANTPGYLPRDLERLDFAGLLGEAGGHLAPVVAAATQPGHIAGQGSGRFAVGESAAFEIKPNGNGVTLEEQMMMVTENSLDYGIVTSLYEKNIGLLRLALGRR